MNVIGNFRRLKYVLKGYTYTNVREYLEAKEKGTLEIKTDISNEKLFSVLPFNKDFDKILNDRLSYQYVLYKYRKHLPKCYYIKLSRNDKLVYFKNLEGNDFCYTSIDEIINCLESKKNFIVCSSSIKNENYEIFSYDGENYRINDVGVKRCDISRKLMSFKSDTLIMESFEKKSEIFHVTVLNQSGMEPEIVEKDGCAELSDLVSDTIFNIAKDFPAIEYMYFTLSVCDSNFKILSIDTGYDLPYRAIKSERIIEFINHKIREKESKKGPFHLLRILKKYIFAFVARKKGFETFMYKNWLKGKVEDYKTTDLSLRQKIWAHKNGFYSYRIEQYGLSKENKNEFLSDYDYKRLRPLNNVYQKWLWNKGFFSLVLQPFYEYLTKEYYYVIPKLGKNILCSRIEEYENGIEGLIDLIKAKGIVAMKPAIGSHGKGFYKIVFKDNIFLVNDNYYSKESFCNFINELDSFFIVSEYIEMNHNLKKIYDGAACTIRFMVINREGCNPVIEHAYYRVGTSDTGFTDNLCSGGIFARINLETGEFNNAEQIVNHKMIKKDCHPDTGECIKGNFEFWNDVKNTIIEIAKYLMPIEYMGFDIVITNNGFKVLEINSHQDLHRYPEYNENIKKYFNNKKSKRS